METHLGFERYGLFFVFSEEEWTVRYCFLLKNTGEEGEIYELHHYILERN